MAISRAQLVKELEPGLNALFGLEYKRYENQHAEIYTTESSDRAFEEEVMLSGFANAEDITAFVIDNPLQLFAVGVDGAITAASYGLTASMTQAIPAGSTSSGQSSKQLNVATNTDNAANQFRLLRSAEDVENEDIAVANSTQIVCQNLNQYMQNTGAAGITWH